MQKCRVMADGKTKATTGTGTISNVHFDMLHHHINVNLHAHLPQAVAIGQRQVSPVVETIVSSQVARTKTSATARKNRSRQNDI